MPYQEKKRMAFHSVSVKIGLTFSRIPLTPNQWTALSLVPAIIAAYLLTIEYFVSAGVLFFAALFIDWIDGGVAKVVGKASAKGAYVDTIVDRYVEGIIIFGLLFAGLPAFFIPVRGWILLMLCGFFFSTYAKSASAEKRIMQEEHKGSFMDRAERVLVLGAGILLAGLAPIYLTLVVAVLAVATNLAALQRIGRVFKAYNAKNHGILETP